MVLFLLFCLVFVWLIISAFKVFLVIALSVVAYVVLFALYHLIFVKPADEPKEELPPGRIDGNLD